MTDEEIVRIHCNACSRVTRHMVRASHTSVHQDEVKDMGPAEERETFEILECMGCEELSVRQTAEHEVYGEATPRFYPAPISRRTPRWKDGLPWSLQAVLTEVYGALQSNSPRLAAMGARTIVDIVLTDKVGDVGSFANKLEALEEKGYVGGKNREFLAVALEAGSAAAHRGISPDEKVLNHVMDIVENLLETVYALEQAANDVRKATPPRKPAKLQSS